MDAASRDIPDARGTPTRDPLRLFDAAANRAAEGLRVMEDLARFLLDDAELCALLKDHRHELRRAVEAAEPNRAERLAHRATPEDVGVSIEGAGEYARADAEGVASAAAGRLTEALRSLEEVSKLLSPSSARAFERLRYASYEADRRLGLALRRAAAPQWRLCVLITEALCAHHAWTEVARRAIAGGADCLQLREKDLDGGELLRRARTLIELARPLGAAVVVNDRLDIALAAGADGVHLGQGDLPVREARRIAGERLRIGVSTSRPEEAHAALDAGADSLGLGPMFPSTTKSKPSLAGPEYVRAVLADDRLSRAPHLAISGITPERASELASLGVRGVAVSSVVCAASDPSAVCERLREALGRR